MWWRCGRGTGGNQCTNCKVSVWRGNPRWKLPVSMGYIGVQFVQVRIVCMKHTGLSPVSRLTVVVGVCHGGHLRYAQEPCK